MAIELNDLWCATPVPSLYVKIQPVVKTNQELLLKTSLQTFLWVKGIALFSLKILKVVTSEYSCFYISLNLGDIGNECHHCKEPYKFSLVPEVALSDKFLFQTSRKCEKWINIKFKYKFVFFIFYFIFLLAKYLLSMTII